MSQAVAFVTCSQLEFCTEWTRSHTMCPLTPVNQWALPCGHTASVLLVGFCTGVQSVAFARRNRSSVREKNRRGNACARYATAAIDVEVCRSQQYGGVRLVGTLYRSACWAVTGFVWYSSAYAYARVERKISLGITASSGPLPHSQAHSLETRRHMRMQDGRRPLSRVYQPPMADGLSDLA